MIVKNRGMLLESIINCTLNFYNEQGLAMFHKKGLEVRFASVNKTRTLNNAWISEKSTVDYYGIYNGRFCAFEAKSVEKGQLLHKGNIKAHQIKYLAQINACQGIAFFIIAFISFNRFFMLDFQTWTLIKAKPLTISLFSQYAVEIPLTYPGIIDFIPFLKIKAHP